MCFGREWKIFRGRNRAGDRRLNHGIGLEQRLTAEILLAEIHGTQPPSVNGVDDVRAIGDWHESRAGAAGDKSETSCPGSALNPLALAAESSTRIVPDMPRKTREERAKCHLPIAAAWSRLSWEVCLCDRPRGDFDDALEGDDIWAISDGACRLKGHTEALCRSAGLAVI